MSEILFVSSTDMPLELAQMFKRAGYGTIDCAKSGNEARRRYAARNYSVIIVNTPLVDELGDRVALDCFNSTSANAIVIAKSEIASSLEERLEYNGVVVFAKPVSARAMYKVVSLFRAQEKRMAILLDQNQKLKDKVEEIKVVSRAKMLLMEKLKMTEDDAHRHLDKTAKDQRITKKEVAENIINMYV